MNQAVLLNDQFQGFHRYTSMAFTFEVFYVDPPTFRQGPNYDPACLHQDLTTPGWYWWACHPGCLPDGEPSGPFPTSEGAYLDAIGD